MRRGFKVQRLHKHFLARFLGRSKNRTKLYVPFRIIWPPRDFFEVSKKPRNSEKSRKKEFGVKKKGCDAWRPNNSKWYSMQQVNWKTEKHGWPTITFSQGSYTVSANVDSSQILRLQKKIANLDFERLVMLNEGLGCGSISGRRDIILDVKNRWFYFERLFIFVKRGKSHF